MVSCPFHSKEHCRKACVFRVEAGKRVACLIREALLEYLGFEGELRDKEFTFNQIKEEE